MRKISYESALAFAHRYNYRKGNTEVTVNEHDRVTYMRLHGNVIASIVGIHVRVTLAGYGTPTTRERVNGLLTVLADEFNWPHRCRFMQEDGKQVFVVHSHGEAIYREVIYTSDVVEFDIDNGFCRVVC